MSQNYTIESLKKTLKERNRQIGLLKTKLARLRREMG